MRVSSVAGCSFSVRSDVRFSTLVLILSRGCIFRGCGLKVVVSSLVGPRYNSLLANWANLHFGVLFPWFCVLFYVGSLLVLHEECKTAFSVLLRRFTPGNWARRILPP